MRAVLAIPALLFATAAFAAGAFSIDDIAGVYKDRFENGLVDGSTFRSENVLEIVKLSPTEAYIRAHMEFYNGHICGVWGVARLEGRALVYRPQDDVESKCVLTLRREGDRIVFGDSGDACKYDFCGMRGSFQGNGFALSSRRRIRYMNRLVASREYGEAIAERKKK